MRPSTLDRRALPSVALLVILVALLAPSALSAQHEGHEARPAHSPYAGTGSDEVPTLTAAEVSQLREGAGMGLARPAEMNGYPGPRHVLDLADSLALTAEQRERTREIFDVMHQEAVRLGEAIIETEKALAGAFAGGAARADIELLVARLGGLRGTLRWVHLRAHLEQAEVLTRHQRHEYERLRGYGEHSRDGH